MAHPDIAALVQESRKRKWADRDLTQHADDLAQELLDHSQKLLTADERALLTALTRMVEDEKNRRFVEDFCTQVLGPQDMGVQAENLHRLLADFGGVPAIFGTMAKLRLKAAGLAARSMQAAAIAEAQRVFRRTFAELTLPTRVEKVNQRVRDFGKQGLSLLLNPLVPVVYGPKSAARYRANLEGILSKQAGVGIVLQPERLNARPDCYAPEVSAKQLAEEIRTILQAAKAGDGTRPVSVEFGTMATRSIITQALKQVLAEKEFYHADVMVELPAYLTESPALLRDLEEWAGARAAKGGSPLKVLLVKGSHLEAEKVCAATYGMPHAVSSSKAETEARYLRLTQAAVSASPKAITPVFGTHNLYNIAYALPAWGSSGRKGLPPFVFLAGMANHVGRLLANAGAPVSLVYGVSGDGEQDAFEHYLATVSEELARPDSFTSASNDLGWNRLRQIFLAATTRREEPNGGEALSSSALPGALDRAYVADLYTAAAQEVERTQSPLPLVINGQPCDSPLTCISRSPSAPGVEDYRFVAADFPAIDRVMESAELPSASPEERRKDLLRLARELEKQRLPLIAAMIRDAGFTAADADAEMRDAIDACRLYELHSRADGLCDGTEAQPLGVVTVNPGSTHPVADAVAGIAAAWVMGNAVVYKPADCNELLGHRLHEVLQAAGMKEPALQLLPCLDKQWANKAMSHARTAAAIHGSDAAPTPALQQRNLFTRHLCSPTGRTTLYISDRGDWHHAVRDLSRSALARSGAAPTFPGILLVHEAVYTNDLFFHALKDAFSAVVAHAGHRESPGIGPIPHPLTPEQVAQLTTVQDDETWLLQPHTGELGSQIWTPGIRCGVKPGSLFLQHAGGLPLFGLMRVSSLDQAIALQTELSDGPAAAIYSNSEEEIRRWSQAIGTGNLFINCCPAPFPAVQPFGGQGTGAGALTPQSFGPNYLTALARWKETARPQHRGKLRTTSFAPWEILSPKPSPDELTRLTAAADSISYWWQEEFSLRHTTSPAPGQEVTREYLPRPVCLRVEESTTDSDLCIALMTALRAGCRILLSTHATRPWMPTALRPFDITITAESRSEYEARFPEFAAEHLFLLDPAAPASSLQAAAALQLPLCTAPVPANARIGMLTFLRERTVTTATRHFE